MHVSEAFFTSTYTASAYSAGASGDAAGSVVKAANWRQKGTLGAGMFVRVPHEAAVHRLGAHSGGRAHGGLIDDELGTSGCASGVVVRAMSLIRGPDNWEKSRAS